MTRQVAGCDALARLRRVALEPFRAQPDLGAVRAAMCMHAASLVRLLVAEGLAPLWRDWIASVGLEPQAPPALLADLAQQRREAVGRYLLQVRAAARTCDILADAGIRSGVFKGGAARERLYADASARPTEDIDILIGRADRDRALQVLGASGFAFGGHADSISHEAALRYGYVDIDLHWHLFRPGRSRIDLAPPLLGAVEARGALAVLGDDANLFTLLVHPAFVKHVDGRASRLVRIVDLDRMLRLLSPDWDWILSLIDAAGLRFAAWSVLYSARRLMDTPLDPTVIRRLEPGPLQRRYLSAWIDRGLPARLGGIPGLVQGAFTLALHERSADAGRALVRLALARWEAAGTLRSLRALAETGRF